MGRIIISRELSFFHARQTVKVYADGKKVRQLHSEGEITTLPIENESVAVQVKEWGFKSRPVTVKDGQTVLIYPRMLLVCLDLLCLADCLVCLMELVVFNASLARRRLGFALAILVYGCHARQLMASSLDHSLSAYFYHQCYRRTPQRLSAK